MSLPPGTRLAQYEVIAPLGSGGMGEVYRARDLRLARDVAIKVMAEHLAADPAMRKRFETEARAVAALSHQGILSIHELGLVDGRPFAVMELLEGQTLRTRLDTGPMAWRDAVRIAAQIADGLAAAHVKGIIHRDLKPENIFLTSDGTVKILDFGLALHRYGVSEPTQANASLRTAPGVVLGTFGYMSPEQVTGENVDGRSDIFAAGCLLYEMLTGRRLFDGTTPRELIANLLHDSLPDLRAIDPAAPGALRAIVARCVDRQAARRFGSATDVAMALRALLTNTSETTGARRPRLRGKSLAVLPFVNTVKDPQVEYLSDGITESIINSLSQLPGLRVVPRSLVFRYKGLQTDPATVGLALNARTILTGHIVQQGDMLHIQAELVDTASESQLWGERFRHKTSELLTVQEEIAWQISEALRLKLSGEHQKKLRRRPTVNNEAYQEYLRGRHCWHQWGPLNFQRAIDHFERALSFDPAYALAYTGLGNAYGALAYYGVIRPTEGFPKARAAAERALALDDRLSDAHVVIALERLFYGWDHAAAEEALAKALRLDPDSALAYAVKSLVLISSHRFEEALKTARHARALDPLSPFINMGVAWVYHFWGHPADAVRELQEVLAFRPGLEEAGSVLITAYESLGRFEEAAALMEKQACWGLKLDGAALAAAYRRGGPEAYWRERLVEMRKGGEPPVFASFSFATVHCHLGEFDLAVDHLERMVDAHAGGTMFIDVENTISRLRGFPRYDALLKRIGAPRPQTVSTPHTASP